jgi:hypothetical protein
MNQHMKSPCAKCPFRKDSAEGWLGKDRMAGIVKAESFVCHKTTSGTNQDRKQCAGHMILMGERNAFVRSAKAFKFNLGLQNRELIFDSPEDCINHHE